MADINLKLSPTMRTEVDKVLKGIGKSSNEANVYNITAKFVSELNPTMNLEYSREIKKIHITQNFVENFTDKIILKLEIGEQDYLALYHSRRDLFATLSFTKFNPHTKLPDHKAPDYEATYRAIILDNADIFKQISGSRLNNDGKALTDREQVTFNMEIELLAEDVYVSRKARFHCIARKVKIADMIRYAAHFFGFSKAVVAQPDNTREYVNFVIPPDFGVADIMSFFQNAPGMGVYSNGFCSYITQGCWYVFPRYGDPICRRPVHLYAVGTNNFEGLNRYSWNEKLADDIATHIIINGEVQERNWSTLGSENKVNSANIQQDHLVVDNSRILKKDGEFTMEPVLRNVLSIPTDPMNQHDLINLEFRHSNCNNFTIKSELQAYQVTTITFTWKSCDLFTFHPGTIVNYNYEHQDGYRTIQGMCESVEYIFLQDEGRRIYPAFYGTAQATIACNNVEAIKNNCV